MRISDWSSDVCSSDLVQERLGIARQGMNDPEGAAEALERAIALEPDRHTAYTQLFTARLQHKRHALAPAVAARMKTPFPARISAEPLLGTAHLRTRHTSKAHAAFAPAVERERAAPAAPGQRERTMAS